jgi:hypothetical protein
MTDTDVDIDVLAADATGRWAPWRDRLTGIGEAIPADPAPADFSLIPGAGDVAAAYARATERLRTYIGEGAVAFQQFYDMIDETCVDYLEDEGASEAEIAAFRQRAGLE